MTLRNLRYFFNEKIWLEEIESLPFLKRALYRGARISYIVVKGFSDERLNQQAAALTYVFFLSLIPLIAVLFGLAKGFGFRDKVEPWIRDALYLVDKEILDQIINYIDATNLATLGVIGLLVLIWTILKTLFNLERSFNQIWDVQQGRPMYRALAYYLSVVLIVPLLVAASTTVTALLRTGSSEISLINWLQTKLGTTFISTLIEGSIPFVIAWVAFSLLYVFMVNTHVRLFPAIVGAFITTLLWNLLLWLYIETQIGLFKNTIYGTFAFLPVFLVFLFLSWLIILFGSRIAFALQNERAFRRDKMADAGGIRFLIASGLLILKDVAEAFLKGRKPIKAPKIAEKQNLPLPLVLEVLSHLERAGILCSIPEETKGGKQIPRLVPARALETIYVSDVISALETRGGIIRLPEGAGSGSIREVLDKVEESRIEALKEKTIQELLTP